MRELGIDALPNLAIELTQQLHKSAAGEVIKLVLEQAKGLVDGWYK
nr:hypothetical protein [Photobacterium lutimaris]